MNDLSGNHQVDGRERIARIQDALKSAELETVVCTLPSFVLMLSGYWPVIGTAIAVATVEGEVALLVPTDELRFASHGWAHRIRTFSPGALDHITTPAIAAAEPLRQLLHDMNIHCTRTGYERGAASEPATYAGMNLYSASIVDMLRVAAPSAALSPADEVLGRLSSSKTPPEVQRVRVACQIAKEAYAYGRPQIRVGGVETGLAALYRAGFSVYGMTHEEVLRADGFAWCMSGPNSAEAGSAFAYSRHRQLQMGDFVLIHSNSYADGYWTDITRTQVLGDADEKQSAILTAIFEARAAAFAKIKSGAKASDVDMAAREVLTKRGFDFPHSLGHGVGFAAISANARPRIHPQSDELLETGMTFNIEPAVYIEGVGGARHCDMVAVTEAGMELLTDF